MMKLWRCLPYTGLLVVLAGCNPSTSEVQSGGTATLRAASTTAAVKRQDIVGYSFFDAKLVIPNSAQATAFSPYDTPVVSVSTGVGKCVERGEPIVKLTIPGADQATSQAKINSSIANSALSDQKNAASGQVQAAQQALKDAQAAEKSAQDTVANGGNADVAAATQARIDAEAALRDAQQKMQQTLEPAKQVAETSAAQLQAVKADADKGIVRAPISGTVIALAAQPGMDAKSNQSLATIVDFSAVRIQATVPPELKGIITRGSRVIVAMNGPSSEPVEGRVLSVRVTPPASGAQNPGYLVNIEFSKPRSMAQTSLSVRQVGIKTGQAKNVIVVPVGAVTTQSGKSTVKVQKGSDWVSTAVETGLSDGAMIEIKSGLSEGDTVQVSTSF